MGEGVWNRDDEERLEAHCTVREMWSMERKGQERKGSGRKHMGKRKRKGEQQGWCGLWCME